jgi:UDP-3-O-[3-hydroxymyristoyl] glucosamine N-acyltransferase
MMGNNTIIEKGTKTDAHVHIAHGVKIGKSCLIIAGVTIGGSVTIEENVWIGLSSVLTNGVTIQSGAFIGAGANVLTNVSKNTNVIGMPGKHLLKRKE